MKHKNAFLAVVALAIAAPVVSVAVIASASGDAGTPSRPEGPCDVYAAANNPCAAAHSTTRALYASYNGPLYQVIRNSDDKTLDIGVVQPSAGDPGGYADAAAQDEFCENTTCWISIIYDQSGNGNHLTQAPQGGFWGPAMGGLNNLPLADAAPVTIMGGHKVYGTMIVPGMGLRCNDAKLTAVDDQAEGQYWVVSGEHYNNGCCFDYGNAEIDSRDNGDGTMATLYFGNAGGEHVKGGKGPWIQTDQENHLAGCVEDETKLHQDNCPGVIDIPWRFVTATADGEPHHWRTMGGNAQGGEMITMWDGKRIVNKKVNGTTSSYDPMRKEGAILLGNGGDNSFSSSGTFYEGAMTEAGYFPTVETVQKMQANVVAARYDVQRLAVAAADNGGKPSNVQTFTPRSKGLVAATFVNTTGETIKNLKISLSGPKRWKSFVKGTRNKAFTADYEVAPGQTVVATFEVKTPCKVGNGDLKAVATWTNGAGVTASDNAVEKVRNVPAIKINEISKDFVEIYNAGDRKVKFTGWTLTGHIARMPWFSSIKIPKKVVLKPGQFYLLGLSNSGLAVDAAKGDKTIYVRNVKGMKVGDEVQVGFGSSAETRKIAAIKTTEPIREHEIIGLPTHVWQSQPDNPLITFPAGTNHICVVSVDGFREGDKMAIGYGSTYPVVANKPEKYEVVTITKVGKPGTQAWLVADAKAGDTVLKVSDLANISVGDTIRLDIASKEHGIETVRVKSVGTAQTLKPVWNSWESLTPFDAKYHGTGLELEEPLKYNHAANLPFAVSGTGIEFTPASKYDHCSYEPVLPLNFAIELDEPLAANHPIDDVVLDKNVKDEGYQGAVPADQLFGGPVPAGIRNPLYRDHVAHGDGQGNFVLRDTKGNIVDAVNYGMVVDGWASEGFQGEAGRGQLGNFAPAPVPDRADPGFKRDAKPYISVGRVPDGRDLDDNKYDFQKIFAPTPGAANISK